MQTYADSTPHSALATTVAKAAGKLIDNIVCMLRMMAYKMRHFLLVEFNIFGLTHNNKKIPVMASI